MARATPDISGKRVLITGPARGIGAETARQLDARGARVSLVGVEPERLDELAGGLRNEPAVFEADVRDAAAIERAVSGTVERFGGIDVVVANAGVAPPVTTIRRMDPEAFERVIDINLLGVWRTLRATLPHVIESRGYVLPVASLAAALHAPMMGPYAAAKAGVEALGNVLRAEVRDLGVDVGVAYFGWIDTDMVRDGFEEPAFQKMRENAPAFLFRPLPVSRAAQGLVRGIERRARRVVVPPALYPAVLASGVFQHLSDLGSRSRSDDLTAAMRLAEGDEDA